MWQFYCNFHKWSFNVCAHTTYSHRHARSHSNLHWLCTFIYLYCLLLGCFLCGFFINSHWKPLEVSIFTVYFFLSACVCVFANSASHRWVLSIFFMRMVSLSLITTLLLYRKKLQIQFYCNYFQIFELFQFKSMVSVDVVFRITRLLLKLKKMFFNILSEIKTNSEVNEISVIYYFFFTFRFKCLDAIGNATNAIEGKTYEFFFSRAKIRMWTRQTSECYWGYYSILKMLTHI